jgi:hypothetical protein
MKRALTIGCCLAGCLALAGIANAQTLPSTRIRVRLPDAAALKTAASELKTKHSATIAGIEDVEQCRAVIKQLTEEADESSELAEVYLLRKAAITVSAKNGLWRDALALTDQLCGEFNVSAAAAHSDTALAIKANELACSQQGLDVVTLADLLADVLERCISEDHYARATELVEALSLCMVAGGRSDPRAEEYGDTISNLREKYDAQAAPAKVALEKDPLDRDAHQTLANYYWQKADWEAALPHFALGSDAQIRALAMRELRMSHSPKESSGLANDYRQASSAAANPEARRWLQARSLHWELQATIGDPTFDSLQRGRLNGNRAALSDAPGPGAAAARSSTPLGAALWLTFDDVPRTANQPDSRVAFSNNTILGVRQPLFDLSPRRNHVEGLRQAPSSPEPVAGSAWLMGQAPLVVSRRLMEGLPAFTWIGWINSTSPGDGTFFAEPSGNSGNRSSPEPRFYWRYQGNQPHLAIAPSFAAPGVARQAGFNVALATPNRGQLRFVAVTIDYAQRLHLTIDGQTVTRALGVIQRANRDGTTIIGPLQGVVDEVAFYPRPLSTAEVRSLYLRGLYQEPLARYRIGKQVETTPVPDLPRLISQPLNTNVAGNDPRSQPNTGFQPNTGAQPNTFGQPPAVARLPKPTDEDIAEARKVVRDIYAADFAKANSVSKRRDLATKIKQVAYDTKDSSASRYACLHEAAELLTEAEVPEAYDAWEELARHFDVSVVREKSGLLDRLQKKAKIATDHKFLADAYVKLLNDAVQSDDYVLAQQLANKAEVCVKRAGDEVLERTVERGIKDLKQMKVAFDEAKKSKPASPATKQDAGDSFAWGKYLCLYRGQWSEGLPLLARGEQSETLAALAKSDAGKPTTAKAQQELADGWWKAAEAEKSDRAQRQLRMRAAHWYQQALPSAGGLQAVQMRQRISDSQAENSPIPVGVAFDALSMIDLAVHGVAGRWQRDKGAIAAMPDNNGSSRTSELVVPIGLHGDYSFATRIDWAGPGDDLMLRLPVEDRFVNLHLGRSMQLEVNSNKVRLLHPATALERGRRYEVIVNVQVDKDEATIEVKLNSRPYLSWQGPLSDIQEAFGRQGQFGQPRPQNAAPNRPAIRIVCRDQAAFVITTLQLQIKKGWAEPIVNADRAWSAGGY